MVNIKRTKYIIAHFNSWAKGRTFFGNHSRPFVLLALKIKEEEMGKIKTYKPEHNASGTGFAVKEFVNFMPILEEAHRAKIKMIKAISFFGFVRIKYEILENKGNKNDER